MCGRFSLYFFPDAEREFEERFGIPFPTLDFPDSYNIPPQTDIAVVVSERRHLNQVQRMFWGLIPSFAREFKPHPQYTMSNTRVESFDKKKHDFRKELLVTSRCVVPANNYFEWMRVGARKAPLKIELKDSPLMSLGAIYSVWVSSTGERHYSCSIITVPANKLLEKIHPRMPLILDRESEKLWLDRGETNPSVLREAMRPYPDEGLQYFPVSRRVNTTRNNDPSLVVPLPELDRGDPHDLFR